MKQPASFAVIVTLCCFASSQNLSNGTSTSRSEGVERNLAGLNFLEGNAPQRATLSQRMADLHIPGVTMAAIHSGKIDWARGYGVATIGGHTVTPATLFSVESMSKPVTALAVLKP